MKLIKSVLPYLAMLFPLISLGQGELNPSSNLKSTVEFYSEQDHIGCLHHRSCQTLDLLDAFRETNKHKVEMSDRPSFQGSELIATLDHFVFHYSLDGPSEERIDPTDSDDNGFPDYLEFMALIFQEVADDYHHERGFPRPPYDGDGINEAYYDIYISNLIAGDGIYGFVQPETKIGDNPATPIIETESTTSYMAMRSDYIGFGPNQAFSIQVTAAHEYVHSIQFAYFLDMDRWLFEGSAAMMEDYMYPGLDDNFQYLENLFKVSDAPMNLDQGEIPQLGNHWYSTWTFWQFLIERTNIDIIRDVFESGIDYYAYGAIESALQDYDIPLQDAIVSYYIANALLTDDLDAAPFVYNRADDYRREIQSVRWESQIEYDGAPVIFNSQVHGNSILMRTSCDYHRITSSQDFTVTANFEKGQDDVRFYLVNVDGTGSIIRDVLVNELTFDGTNYTINIINSEDFDYYILLPVRTNFTSKNLESLQYEFLISPLMNTPNKDLSSSFNIEIYPTITNGIFFIESNDYLGEYTIQVLGMDGCGVWTETMGKCDLSDWPSGVYQIILRDKRNNLLHKEKIVKP